MKAPQKSETEERRKDSVEQKEDLKGMEFNFSTKMFYASHVPFIKMLMLAI